MRQLFTYANLCMPCAKVYYLHSVVVNESLSGKGKAVLFLLRTWSLSAALCLQSYKGLSYLYT